MIILGAKQGNYDGPDLLPFQGIEGLAQTAGLPLVPYVDTLRWVCIAVGLGGIAAMIYARLAESLDTRE